MNNHIKSEVCPVCGEGIMTPHTDKTFKFKFKRQVHTVMGLSYAKCESCGLVGYLHGQLSANKKIVEEYQKKLAPLFSPKDILSLREKYLLTQEKAAKIFGGGIGAFSKWERGIITPAEPTAKLMLLAYENPEVMMRLAKIAGVKLKLPDDCKIDRSSEIGVSVKVISSGIRGCIPDFLISYPNLTPLHHFNLLDSTQTINIESEEDQESYLESTWAKSNQKTPQYTLN